MSWLYTGVGAFLLLSALAQALKWRTPVQLPLPGSTWIYLFIELLTGTAYLLHTSLLGASLLILALFGTAAYAVSKKVPFSEIEFYEKTTVILIVFYLLAH